MGLRLGSVKMFVSHHRREHGKLGGLEDADSSAIEGQEVDGSQAENESTDDSHGCEHPSQIIPIRKYSLWKAKDDMISAN